MILTGICVGARWVGRRGGGGQGAGGVGRVGKRATVHFVVPPNKCIKVKSVVSWEEEGEPGDGVAWRSERARGGGGCLECRPLSDS